MPTPLLSIYRKITKRTHFFKEANEALIARSFS